MTALVLADALLVGMSAKQCKESLGSGREIKAGLLLSGFNTKNACGIQFFLQAFLRYFFSERLFS